MLFNSLHFLIFLPTVALVHFAISDLRHRKFFLLAASYYFYAVWSIPFVTLLAASTAFGFLSARWIEASDNRGTRKLMLVLNLVVNLGILVFFKYFNFISMSLGNLVGFEPWPLHDIVLPLLVTQKAHVIEVEAELRERIALPLAERVPQLHRRVRS